MHVYVDGKKGKCAAQIVETSTSQLMMTYNRLWWHGQVEHINHTYWYRRCTPVEVDGTRQMKVLSYS